MKRRSFVLYAGTGSAMLLTRRGLCATRAVSGGSLNPAAIQKFEMSADYSSSDAAHVDIAGT